MLHLLHSYISLGGQQHFQLVSYIPGFCLLCKTHILLYKSIYPLNHTITLWQMGRRLNYFNIGKGCDDKNKCEFSPITRLNYSTNSCTPMNRRNFSRCFKNVLFKYTGKRSGSCCTRHAIVPDTFIQ